MIEIKVSGKSYNIKSSWNEFTYSDYVRLYKSDNTFEKLSVCTGVEVKELQRFNIEQLHYITGLCAFASDAKEAIIFAQDFDGKIDIGRESYGKLENAKLIIRNAGNPILAGVKLVENYFGDDISDKPVLNELGKVIYLTQQIDKFLEVYKELFSYEPSIDEELAGIGDLAKLGFMPTAINLARSFGLKLNDVLSMPAKEVYTILLTDYREAKFRENLMELNKKKK